MKKTTKKQTQHETCDGDELHEEKKTVNKPTKKQVELAIKILAMHAEAQVGVDPCEDVACTMCNAHALLTQGHDMVCKCGISYQTGYGDGPVDEHEAKDWAERGGCSLNEECGK